MTTVAAPIAAAERRERGPEEYEKATIGRHAMWVGLYGRTAVTVTITVVTIHLILSKL